MSKPVSRRAGFTLVELLAITVVLGILVALLMPSLVRARERARKAVCTGHLRQLAQAAYLYQSDFNRLPVSTLSGYLVWNGLEYVGFGQLIPQQGRPMAKLLYCPSNRQFAPSDKIGGTQNLGVAGKVTVGCYSVRGISDGAPRVLPEKSTALMADLVFGEVSSRNHPEGLHVMFSDGSVQFLPVPDAWDITAPNAWAELDAVVGNVAVASNP